MSASRAALLVLVLAGACGSSPESITTVVKRGGAPALAGRSEAEALWAERLDRARLEEAIAAYRRVTELADDDAASWLMLARAEYFLADEFLDPEHADNGLVTRTFERGAAAAERGLRARFPRFEARRRAGAEVDEAAADLGLEAVPYVYWWGLNAIRWADRKGWTAALHVYKPVNRVMEKVAHLWPEYEHGGADRYLGAFYAGAPAFAGGDAEKGRRHLTRALALSPAYLETYVVVAERLARPTHDQRLFDEALRVVRDTAASVVPDAIPEQEMAKRKARTLAPKLWDVAAR